MVQLEFPQESNRLRSLGNLGMAKRKFRIVKRENNIPVLGVCEYCHAEFAADPETIGRPKDAHAHLQKQFIAHKCKRLDASKKRGADRGRRLPNRTEHIGTPSVTVAISDSAHDPDRPVSDSGRITGKTEVILKLALVGQSPATHASLWAIEECCPTQLPHWIFSA